MEDSLTTASAPQASSRLRTAGRVLALLWGGFWTIFGLAAGSAEAMDPAGILVHALVPGMLFLAAALIAWRWQSVGAALLIAGGLATLPLFPWARTAQGFLFLPLPGVAAGAALLLDRVRRGRSRNQR